MSRSDFEDQLDIVYEDDDLRAFLFQAVDRSHLRAEGDPDGSFQSVPLPPGPAEITVAAAGFEPATGRAKVVAGSG